MALERPRGEALHPSGDQAEPPLAPKENGTHPGEFSAWNLSAR